METTTQKPVQYRNLQPVSYEDIHKDKQAQEHLKSLETHDITRDFVEDMADWNTWVTGSFVGGRMPLALAQKRHEEFHRHNLDDATHFTAFELHNNGIGWHFHSLMHLPDYLVKKFSSNNTSKYGSDKYVPKLWKMYFDNFGRSTLSPIRNTEDVTSYCIKHVLDYTTKADIRGVGVYTYHFGSSDDGSAFMSRHLP
tara:strand:+ start:724 stop:1314 length:591 start_codon:yes stop_codon:yes gene_type:complete